MTWKPDVCIYHFPCNDGFGAAWAVHKRWPDVQFIGCDYKQEVPFVGGANVLIVDFSFKPEVLRAMEAVSIVILDHHKSALTDLEEFTVAETLTPEALSGCEWHEYRINIGNIIANFDMARSGARMAWDFCFPGRPEPALISRIEDRDLWRFQYPETRGLHLLLQSLPYDFKVWDELMNDFGGMGRELLLAQASAVERYYDRKVEELLSTSTTMCIGDAIVPVVNAPFFMASDIGNRLCERDGAPFAVVSYREGDTRVFSLRSNPGGADVQEIARQYGGGGHARAAGFKVPA